MRDILTAGSGNMASDCFPSFLHNLFIVNKRLLIYFKCFVIDKEDANVKLPVL